MIKLILKKHILKNRALILQESQHMAEFIQFLMKRRNTGVKWTGEEITRLKSHLKHLSLYVPVLIIFVLPFGSFLLPILAEILDRREKSRTNKESL
jgi:hypothetical protein